MLVAKEISYVMDGRPLLANASLALAGGEVLAIIGPNGAGKSTLLRLLARESAPSAGTIELNGKALLQWSPIELARRRAVLPQAESLRFAFDVQQVVQLGRYPWSAGPSGKEARIVDEAMRAAGVECFAARSYTKLSAGERARVQLARVLAQIWEPSVDGSTRFLLLDEPTASLDLAHQHEVLGAIRQFAATGAGVAMVLHDLNLAMRYADRVLLMKDGRIDSMGPTCEVLDVAHIQRVFGVEVDLLTAGSSGHLWIAPRPRSRATARRVEN